MIIGYFDRGEPFVQGRLVIERLEVDEYVWFLVDTGADSTVLNPADGELVGCRFDLLRGNPTPVYGIGGNQNCYSEEATIVFADDDGQFVFPVAIDIVLPDPNPEAVVNELPSLLGRDFINYRLMHYDYNADLLRFY